MSTQVIQAGKESKVAGFSLSLAIGSPRAGIESPIRIMGECYLPIAQDQTQTELQARFSPNSVELRIDQWG